MKRRGTHNPNMIDFSRDSKDIVVAAFLGLRCVCTLGMLERERESRREREREGEREKEREREGEREREKKYSVIHKGRERRHHICRERINIYMEREKIYIYIYIEKRDILAYICIYIYTYIQRERALTPTPHTYTSQREHDSTTGLDVGGAITASIGSER